MKDGVTLKATVREVMPSNHHLTTSRTDACNIFSLFYTLHFKLVSHFKTQTYFPSNIFGLIENGLVELINPFTIQSSTFISTQLYNHFLNQRK